MAKKAVATLHTGNAGRNHTKCIKMVKSPKTGAYIFQEEIVENDKVAAYFKSERAIRERQRLQQCGRCFFVYGDFFWEQKYASI